MAVVVMMQQFRARLRQVVDDSESRIGRHTWIAFRFLDPSDRSISPRSILQLLMRVLTQFCASTSLSSARPSETTRLPGQCRLPLDSFQVFL